MPFYCSYRAAVRAKVAAIRLQQTPGEKESERTELEDQCLHYLRLSRQYLNETIPTLTITLGLSGSGKTTVSQEIIESANAVRIRSDVERKRMTGLTMEDRSTPQQRQQMYSPTQSVAVMNGFENSR